jgi:hypothetical protein
VTLAFVPRAAGVRQLAGLGLSPGVMSAGLGTVPAEQTYLDITQGNRVFDALYDHPLPPERACGPRFWTAVNDRAASAPADIVPGLLSSTLEAAGVGVRVGARAACAFSARAPRTASGEAPKKLREGPRPDRSPIFAVRSMSLGALSSLMRSLHGNDLLIAIARPTGESDEPLAIGIAGSGFHGNLTSDSTRTNGYVLSTDIAPTILGRFGIPVPSQMSGQSIRAAGSVDPAAIESLVERMDEISSRRGPVIGYSLLAWVLALLLFVAATRGRLARTAVRVVGLSVVYLPLALLAGAALEPSQAAEQLLVLLGAPLLGLLTLAVWPGYRALGLASAVTILAYAVDVLAGSPLTSLSLLGPNPGLGARFYGIGNELEALLAVLVVAGTGAALAGFAPRLSPSRCAAAFLLVGLPLAFIFAAGWFGADVGAAIVLPLGAAAAAAAIGARRKRALLLVVVLPLAALALLALIDLVSGANAHLTRSVLDAGGLNDLGQVAQRRLELSTHSFARPVVLAFLPLIAIAALLAVARRDRLVVWTRGSAAMRAGLIGALAATVVGTLANDSGALLLVIGAAYLLVFTGYAWAESPRAGSARPIHYP